MSLKPQAPPRLTFSYFDAFGSAWRCFYEHPRLEKHSCKVHVISMKMVKSKKSQKEIMGGLGGGKN